jgi:hypothetical protein
MFLMQKKEGHLVEILNVTDLVNPTHPTVSGRLHYGEEMQDPEDFPKSGLKFQSGEELPRCWLDAHYRDQELVH